MAINIKDDRTDRLARELADVTGQPITVAVREAIALRLDDLRRSTKRSAGPDLTAIIDRGRARQTDRSRSTDEILGYDGMGLPT